MGKQALLFYGVQLTFFNAQGGKENDREVF
jgi:hypothetical protein